jgi:3',5'-nucleoside bisphosphate phosphatase
MRQFRADLHIHTVLSACADLGMSPEAIVGKAKEKKIDVIGITDHNSTLQCGLVMEIAQEEGLATLCGVEVTTREEVHCLAYFKDKETLKSFQDYLEVHLPVIRYRPEKFGYQVVVDRNEKIRQVIGNYLNVGLNQGIDEVEQEVHRLGGLFVPAHIERPLFGIISQLGFMPGQLECDAYGIMSHSREADIRNKYSLAAGIPLIRASDAHCPEDIGSGCTVFVMNEPTFEEIKKALKGLEGRKTIVD